MTHPCFIFFAFIFRFLYVFSKALCFCVFYIQSVFVLKQICFCSTPATEYSRCNKSIILNLSQSALNNSCLAKNRLRSVFLKLLGLRDRDLLGCSLNVSILIRTYSTLLHRRSFFIVSFQTVNKLIHSG